MSLLLSLVTTKGPFVTGKCRGYAHTHTHTNVKETLEHVSQQKHGADTTSPFIQKVSNWKQKIVSGPLSVWSHPQRWYWRPSVSRHDPLLPPALPQQQQQHQGPGKRSEAVRKGCRIYLSPFQEITVCPQVYHLFPCKFQLQMPPQKWEINLPEAAGHFSW